MRLVGNFQVLQVVSTKLELKKRRKACRGGSSRLSSAFPMGIRRCQWIAGKWKWKEEKGGSFIAYFFVLCWSYFPVSVSVSVPFSCLTAHLFLGLRVAAGFFGFCSLFLVSGFEEPASASPPTPGSLGGGGFRIENRCVAQDLCFQFSSGRPAITPATSEQFLPVSISVAIYLSREAFGASAGVRVLFLLGS